MAETELLRLELVEVERLFDLYDHRIEVNLDERVTILHGPNGVGKTAVLGMIDALLKNHLSYFDNIPFRRFLLGFHDGSALELRTNGEGKNDEGEYKLRLTKDGEINFADIYQRPREKPIPHTGFFRNPTLEALLSATKVPVRPASAEPEPARHPENKESRLNAFLKKANAHFIEAERLAGTGTGNGRGRTILGGAEEIRLIPAVDEYSSDFRERLDATMAGYGRRSQTLDQSFPQRLISATDELTPEELQDRMIALDRKTADLMALGILDETPALQFDVSSLEAIDHTQSRVMTLYVSDTEEKLRELEYLAKRARLLLDNVNEKYRHKRIRLDREKGLVAENDVGKPLPLTSLSSGEQHELVLHYDLLFKVPSNTIVLIDEPELSLHVAWQKNFLPELLEIVRLSDFDALVATHSPYVIGERNDLMVGLGEAA